MVRIDLGDLSADGVDGLVTPGARRPRHGHHGRATAWPALELLALAEPAGLSELEELVGAQALEALERAGLIDVRADRRRQMVRLTHPLYGEVLRDRIPIGRRPVTPRTAGGRRRQAATAQR
jgi:hypothetical protein